MYNQLNKTFEHGKICLQQHGAFINSTTFFFANHGLHPKFDIQGVHKVMNSTTKDWTMWLVDVQAQLVFNLEKTKRWYKKNVNEHWKEQPNFKVGD